MAEVFHSVRTNDDAPFTLVSPRDKQELTIESVAAQSDGQNGDSASFHGNLRYFMFFDILLSHIIVATVGLNSV